MSAGDEMSDTPRTDDESDTPRTDLFCMTPTDLIPGQETLLIQQWVEFARQLERELNAAQARIAELERALDPANYDVLASHSQADGRREWHTVGAWLYPGDAICIRYAQEQQETK
jgi:hypothetical protein